MRREPEMKCPRRKRLEGKVSSALPDARVPSEGSPLGQSRLRPEDPRLARNPGVPETHGRGGGEIERDTLNQKSPASSELAFRMVKP